MIDCKARRDTKDFEVISEYPERMKLNEFRQTVNEELCALAGFAGCDKIIRVKSGRNEDTAHHKGGLYALYQFDDDSSQFLKFFKPA